MKVTDLKANILKKNNIINGPIVCKLHADPDFQSLFKRGIKELEMVLLRLWI